jgi:hypothetical protein
MQRGILLGARSNNLITGNGNKNLIANGIPPYYYSEVHVLDAHQ